MKEENHEIVEKNLFSYETRRSFFWACRCGEPLMERDEAYVVDRQFIAINVRKHWFDYEAFKQHGEQINCVKCGTKLLHSFHHPIIFLKRCCLMLKSNNEI